jgi:uncharacterized protein YkwD
MSLALAALAALTAAGGALAETRSYYSVPGVTSQQQISQNYGKPQNGQQYSDGSGITWTWSDNQNSWVCTQPASSGAIKDGVWYSSGSKEIAQGGVTDSVSSGVSDGYNWQTVSIDDSGLYDPNASYCPNSSQGGSLGSVKAYEYYAPSGDYQTLAYSSAAESALYNPALESSYCPQTSVGNQTADSLAYQGQTTVQAYPGTALSAVDQLAQSALGSTGTYGTSGSVIVPSGTPLSNQSTACPDLPSAFTFTINGVPVTVTNAAYAKDGVSQIYSPANGTTLPWYATANGTGVEQYPEYPQYTNTTASTDAYCPTGSPASYTTTQTATQTGGGILSQVAAATPAITAMEQTSLALLNAERQSNGLAPLAMDSTLNLLARLKSQDMAANDYFAHESETYGKAADMLDAAGYQYAGVGENIAHHENVQTANAAFMSSSGHRANILGSQWTKAGVGVALDDNGYPLITQIFAR